MPGYPINENEGEDVAKGNQSAWVAQNKKYIDYNSIKILNMPYCRGCKIGI